MRAITDAGGEHQCFDKLTEYRNAVDPVSSAELPGTESMAWLFDKHPPLATALNMIYAERCLQAKLSAAYMAWTTKDMHADVFLCDGYGKQLEELGAALTDAKRFKDGANEVILKLRGQQTWQSSRIVSSWPSFSCLPSRISCPSSPIAGPFMRHFINALWRKAPAFWPHRAC